MSAPSCHHLAHRPAERGQNASPTARPKRCFRGLPVELLDGDGFRDASQGWLLSRQDRDENIRRISYVARLLTQHGDRHRRRHFPYRATRHEATRRSRISSK
jgi:adenylylsulfate kinase-like enzyme